MARQATLKDMDSNIHRRDALLLLPILTITTQKKAAWCNQSRLASLRDRRQIFQELAKDNFLRRTTYDGGSPAFADV